MTAPGKNAKMELVRGESAQAQVGLNMDNDRPGRYVRPIEDRAPRMGDFAGVVFIRAPPSPLVEHPGILR